MKPIHTAPAPGPARGVYREVGHIPPSDQEAVGQHLGRTHRVPGTRRGDRRRPLCATTRLSPLNARYRRAVRGCGHFSIEQPAMKTPYLVTRSLEFKSTGQIKMGHQVKAGTEHVRHHLHRPHARGRGPLKMKTPLTPTAPDGDGTQGVCATVGGGWAAGCSLVPRVPMCCPSRLQYDPCRPQSEGE